MKRIFFAMFAAMIVVSVRCGDVRAQATAQIVGTVRDPSGAVLPGVEVTATQTETGVARSAVTNETGSYVLSNLPIGPYRLEAALPGFRTFVQTGIVLQVNGSPVINSVLEVGKVTGNFAKLLPTTSDPCGRIIYGNTQRANLHMALGRIDYQRSDKNSIFGRYLLDSNFSPPSFTLNHNMLSVSNGSMGLGIDALTQAFSLGNTYLLSDNVVNSLRLTANRWVGGRVGVEYAGWPEMGVKMFSYQPKRLAGTVTRVSSAWHAWKCRLQ